CTEVSMATVGGELKRREELSGRLADALAWMYFGSASLHRFVQQGARGEDEALLRWAGEECLYRGQEALIDLLDNLPNRFVATVARRMIFPWGRSYSKPRDITTHDLCNRLVQDEDFRARLCPDTHIPAGDRPGLGALVAGAKRIQRLAPVRRKLAKARRAKFLPRGPELDVLQQAQEKGVLTEAEVIILREAIENMHDLIQV
ncbi:MAG: DUF1974 domain-containing protein, partial [Planctomycetota bacterium]|nr:DUF1974 domain-containing protein [Planctomycetota bacterium]